MNIILSASKAVSEDRIQVITEFDIEQLRRNIVFQYEEKSRNDLWLMEKLEQLVNLKLVEGVPWETTLVIREVKVTLWPKATALCSYSIWK